MKEFSKKVLQSILGFDNYLFVFCLFKIRTFKWDNNEKDFFHFLDMMRPNSHVLDVGSNIGITTVHLSRKVPEGKVYSFEPVPPNFTTLEKVVNHYKCPNVELYNFAVGNEHTEIEMVLPEVNNVKMQGLSHVVHDDLPDFNEGRRYSAPLRRLDDMNFLYEQKIDGIKLDVENFEYFVLKGGSNLLSRDKPVIYAELWDNENRTKCFQLMKELNYSVLFLKNNQLIPFKQGKDETQNFFFIDKNDSLN